MKHQYESEILFRLMERDGFNIPSSVPPYESEIKAYLINQVKLAYPKLTDYEAEWLLYNYTKHLPAEFPISSATNVTKATFENVVPFAYQSAILKGNTLVNLLTKSNIKITNNGFNNIDYVYPLDNTKTYIIRYCVNQLPELSDTSDSARAFKFEWYDGGAVGGHENIYTKYVTIGRNEYIKIEPYYDEISCNKLNIWCMNYASGTLDIDITILEYQDGMENWDIPYFTGMQSVKMPVLTTTGKNLFHVGGKEIFSENNLHQIQNDEVIMENTTYGYHNCSIKYFNLKPNGIYTISYDSEILSGTPYKVVIVQDDQKNRLNNINGTFTAPLNGKVQVRFYSGSTNNIGKIRYYNIQIEEGSTSTSYEPYKSNILTVNEDVTLRGIGDVKDELNLLTGELTQRIGEIVLDGSDDENWVKRNNGDGTNTITFQIPCDVNKHNEIILDKFALNQPSSDGIEGIGYASDVKMLYIEIKRDRLNNVNVDGFKQWLSQNPNTVQYKLTTESVKTVDLKTVNESGESVHFMPFEGTMHVQSSGEIIQPTFDMSVPVEATTQNLASFINLEMEE